MNIIIVAGGLGTRFGTLSIFPKILLSSYKEDSILKEQYNYFNHKENNIYPKFDEAFKKIEKIIGEEKLDELIDINPRKVIANQDIIINEY